MRFYSIRQSIRSRTGAGLVEFLLIIPVLITVAVAMVNIGRVVLQAQVLSDAAKIGARTIVRQSARSVTDNCAALASSGVTAAAAYRNGADRWQLSSLWRPCVTFSTRDSWVYGTAMNIRMATVTFKAKDTSQNCLFCAGTFLKFINATPYATFDLSQASACITDAAAPAEVCEGS